MVRGTCTELHEIKCVPANVMEVWLSMQAWRILQVPSSLFAGVVKARFFKEGTIMNATCLAGAAYTFHSILHGRDVLKRGYLVDWGPIKYSDPS